MSTNELSKLNHRSNLAQWQISLTSPPSFPAIIPCALPLALEEQAAESKPALVLRSESWTVEVAADCSPELLRLPCAR